MELAQQIRVKRHPFTLIGYWDGRFKTSEPKEHAIYTSELKAGLHAIVRLSDQQTRFLVRGQFYNSLSVARKAA